MELLVEQLLAIRNNFFHQEILKGFNRMHESIKNLQETGRLINLRRQEIQLKHKFLEFKEVTVLMDQVHSLKRYQLQM
jgi:hypothetical protein